MVKFSVTFLGTSAGAPSKMRGLTGILMQGAEEYTLLDAGDGVLRQALGLGIDLNRITTVLITHLHGDHVAGLFGLLWAMTLNDRTEPLTIVAPSSLARWLNATCDLLRKGLGLEFHVKLVHANRAIALRRSAFKVRAEKADHSGECFAYVVEERSKPGRRVGYSGDTRPSKTLSRFFRGCDLLISDSTYGTAERSMAVQNKVSTSVDAASLAAEARVRRLVLTHFSTRYVSTSVLVREARSVFPNVVAARDGLRLEID